MLMMVEQKLTMKSEECIVAERRIDVSLLVMSTGRYVDRESWYAS
jgi:hypothetical protein